MDRRKSRHHGLAAFSVDGFAADCMVRKKRRVGTVARGPLSQHANSFSRTEAIASFGLSSVVPESFYCSLTPIRITAPTRIRIPFSPS